MSVSSNLEPVVGYHQLEKKPDPNFFKKQNQIYIWVRYKKFVTMKEVMEVCSNIVVGEEDSIRRWYGQNISETGHVTKVNSPIYKLFFPLLACGIFEKAKYKEEDGYTLSKKLPLVPCDEAVLKYDYTNSLFYRNHFYGLKDNCVNQDDLTKKALEILKSIPDRFLEKITAGWDKDPNFYSNGTYSILSNNSSWEEKCISSESPCIYRDRTMYGGDWGYIYFYDENKHNYENKKIPADDFDCINVAKTIVALRRKLKIIYNNESRELEFIKKDHKWYSSLPVLLSRVLIMFDINQLGNDDVYCANRNYKPFSNIPEEAVVQIERILGKKRE